MQHCLMGAEALCHRPIGRLVPWTLGSIIPGHVHRSCQLGSTLERLPRLVHRPIFAQSDIFFQYVLLSFCCQI